MTDVREHLEHALREAPETSADPGRLNDRRRAKAKMKRITTMTVAAAIGLLPIALGLVIIGGHGGSRSLSGGEIGGPTQDLRLAPGEYYYQRFDAGYGTCESWWALDDSGRLAGADAPQAGGSCWGPKRGTYGPGEFYSDTGDVTYLSTDPAKLDEQLRARTQPDGASPEPYADWGGPIEWGLVRSIRELLEAPDVTPEQKAALFRVAAGIDGMQVDEQATDPSGRLAIELTIDTEHTTQRWWFDPQSEQLLAAEGNLGTIVIQTAGVTGSTDSTDLDRSFFRQVQG